MVDWSYCDVHASRVKRGAVLRASVVSALPAPAQTCLVKAEPSATF